MSSEFGVKISGPQLSLSPFWTGRFSLSLLPAPNLLSIFSWLDRYLYPDFICDSLQDHNIPKSQQGLLATYLIPGCVGRGVRLGSESLSGLACGVWKSGYLAIQLFWDPTNPKMKNKNKRSRMPKLSAGQKKLLTLVGPIVDIFSLRIIECPNFYNNVQLLPGELSDTNMTNLPSHPGIKYVARSPCCDITQRWIWLLLVCSVE